MVPLFTLIPYEESYKATYNIFKTTGHELPAPSPILRQGKEGLLYSPTTNSLLRHSLMSAPGHLTTVFKKIPQAPNQYKRHKITVKIILEFIVEKDGRLSHPRATKSSGYINDKAASPEQLQPFIDETFSVIITSPKWKPAINNEIIVRSYFTVPVEFKNH